MDEKKIVLSSEHEKKIKQTLPLFLIPNKAPAQEEVSQPMGRIDQTCRFKGRKSRSELGRGGRSVCPVRGTCGVRYGVP